MKTLQAQFFRGSLSGRMLQKLPGAFKLSPHVPVRSLAGLGCLVVLLHQCNLEYLGVDQLLSSQSLLSGEVSSQEIKRVTAQEQRSGVGVGDWFRKSAMEE